MLTIRPRPMVKQVVPAVAAGVADGSTFPPPMGRVRAAKGRPPVVVWLPALLVGLGMLVPLAYLVLRASEAGGEVWPLVFRARTALILRNTVALALAVGATAAAVAVPLAWLTARTDLPLRRWWATLAALPLVVPSYVGALTMVAALGPRGILQGWLEPLGVDRLPPIYGFFGAWLTLTLFTYPYVFLGVRAALRGLDPALEEATRGLGHGPWRAFFGCTLPQLRPAVAAGSLLAALYAVSDFGVVTLLRYDTFVRAIYVQYRSSFDRTLAAALALLLVLFAAALVAAEARLRGRAAYHKLGSGSARRVKPVALGWWRYPALAYCAGIVGLALGLPLAVLVYWLLRGVSGGEGLDGLLAASWHSASVSVLAAVAATVAALPVATLAVRYAGRTAALAERLTYLGYALPGVVIGLAFVFLGANYLTPLYKTLPLLVIAYVVRFLPQAVGAARTSLLQVSPRLEEAARGLGRTPMGTTWRVTVPLTRSGLAAGAALVFLTVMKELPVTLFLSPIEYETLATSVWNATSGGAYGKAAAPALLLIAVSAIPTLLLVARDRAPRRQE